MISKKIGIKLNGKEYNLLRLVAEGDKLVLLDGEDRHKFNIDDITDIEVYRIKPDDKKPKRTFKEILRSQILKDEPESSHKELDELDEFEAIDWIDMHKINVENWPEEDGEPLDMENWSIVSINDNDMVMIAGGDWQEGGVMRIGVDKYGDLAVLEVFEYDDEKHGERMSVKEFLKELMK
jgi:hypothetical protein